MPSRTRATCGNQSSHIASRADGNGVFFSVGLRAMLEDPCVAPDADIFAQVVPEWRAEGLVFQSNADVFAKVVPMFRI